MVSNCPRWISPKRSAIQPEAVGNPLDVVQHVRRKEQRATLGTVFIENIDDLLSPDRIKTGKRLIQNQ